MARYISQHIVYEECWILLYLSVSWTIGFFCGPCLLRRVCGFVGVAFGFLGVILCCVGLIIRFLFLRFLRNFWYGLIRLFVLRALNKLGIQLRHWGRSHSAPYHLRLPLKRSKHRSQVDRWYLLKCTRQRAFRSKNTECLSHRWDNSNSYKWPLFIQAYFSKVAEPASALKPNHKHI